MKTEKVSERVENAVGKGKIAHYEQFLLFPQSFQKASTADMFGLFGKGLKFWIVYQRVKCAHIPDKEGF